MLLRNLAITFLAATLAAAPGDLISPDRLRAHVAFLASDKLRGRGNGTPGLEAAADYIAARFKEAGLKPAGTDGFFQPATMIMVQPDTKDFEMAFRAQGVDIKVRLDEVLLFLNEALDVKDAPTVTVYVALAFPGLHTFADKAGKIDYKNMAAVGGLITGALLATANSAEPLE